MNKPIIPHSRPTLGKEEIEAVSRVIASSQIAQGREVEAFEHEFANMVGVKYAAAVSSGTAALHLAMSALGVSSGDEVIVPSYVCTALLNAVNYTGATPVIADIDPDTLNIDPADVAGRITSCTKAIIVPHMFGLMADMGELGKLGVPLIEDGAQAVGASYGDRKAGALGTVGSFSFYATKMMTCGEGGMVVSDSKAVIDRVRHSREYDNRDTYFVRFNYKMTDFQAAMGRSQLEKLDRFITRRREIAGLYDDAFAGLGVELPCADTGHLYYRYVIKVKRNVDRWIGLLGQEGVSCARPVFKPLHLYSPNSRGWDGTNVVFETALSLPLFPSLSGEQVERVISAVTETADRIRK